MTAMGGGGGGRSGSVVWIGKGSRSAPLDREDRGWGVLPQKDPRRGEKEGKKWDPLQSNPNKHPLEGIVFWSGLDASNPI